MKYKSVYKDACIQIYVCIQIHVPVMYTYRYLYSCMDTDVQIYIYRCTEYRYIYVHTSIYTDRYLKICFYIPHPHDLPYTANTVEPHIINPHIYRHVTHRFPRQCQLMQQMKYS